ncbi:MAG: four helix bundle protein [Candidatus Cloacimonetes bacterium]|nr:four helix bundle protein [Candidatus Cloacimonadota bacterium]MDY0368098.1 four helix bundle protein [Candidatus Syntrophosphaera sp.]
MSKVECFEGLQVWRMAHDLSVEIYRLTKNGEFSRDWGLRDQIQRASVSVMSNIAEGFERYSRQEFKQFLSIARGSCAEVRSQIQLAKSLGYVADADCSAIYDKCLSLSRAIGGLRSSLDRSAKE